MLDPLKAC